MKKSRVLCMLIIAMLTFSMTAEVTVLPVAAKTSTSTKKSKKKSKKKSTKKKSTKKSSKKSTKKSSKKKSSSSTTTPAASAPAASAPVAAAPSAPVVSAPAASAPAASTPAASAPAAPAPAASATPQTEAPAAKAPAVSTPAASAPAASTPSAKTPAASTPAAKTPAASAPAAKTPAASAPAAKAPAASAPAAKAPAASAPAASTPSTTAPAAPATSQTEAAAPKKAAETEHVCEFTNWVVTKEPYCGYMGYDMTWRDTGEEVGTCAVCGKKKTRGLRVENHDFELVSETTATCEKGGTKTYKCKDCGYKKTETVMEALGHDMKHYDDPATCTEDGHSYDKCSRCGLVTNDVKTADKLGHNFNVGDTTQYIVRQASCTQAGLIEIPCQNGCGTKTTKYIPATGHQMSEETVAATCTANQKIVSTCSVCGYQETKEIPNTKLGHQMEAGIGEASTMTRNGYTVNVCTRCSYEQRETLPLATHEHTWKSVKEIDPAEAEGVLASMSNGMIQTQKCTTCNEMRYAYNINGEWVPWEKVPCNGAGHTWNGGERCTVCGMTKPGSEGSANASHRIVWSVTIRTQVNGVCAIQPTTISADNCIKYTAPEVEGYEFAGWTWSGSGLEIPAELFSDAEGARRSLNITCDYMDMVFTANYSKIGDAAAALSSISVDPEALPSVIHGEMSLDLNVDAEPTENAAAESAGENPAAQEAEGQEEIIVHEEEE